jgi:hypothetical protein
VPLARLTVRIVLLTDTPFIAAGVYIARTLSCTHAVYQLHDNVAGDGTLHAVRLHHTVE